MNKAYRKQTYATVLLVLVVAIGELFGLPGLGLSKPQEITACILIIAAVLWVSEWVPLFVVGFLILALEMLWLLPELNTAGVDALTNTIVKSDVFFAAFFSNIILLFLGGFVLSSIMQKYGLDLQLAQAILQKTKGKPAATLLGIILCCAFLSMWMSNTATTAMMLTIIFPLLKDIPPEHPFRIGLVLSIPFACNIGGIGTPIGTPPNAIALSYLSETGVELSFAQWMLLAMPFLIILLSALWLLLLKLYPAQGLELTIQKVDDFTFTKTHGLAVSIFFITALGWFFGKALGLKTGTVALLPVIAAFWFGLLDTADFRKLPWDILYIISGGLALGIAIDLSGLGDVIVAALPMDGSPIIFIGVAITAFALISTVMSNTATAGLVIPLVMSFDLPQPQLLALVVGMALLCSMSMSLPVTTPPNAIAFSSRVIKTKDMILSGSIMTFLGFSCIGLIGPWYWDLLVNSPLFK